MLKTLTLLLRSAADNKNNPRKYLAVVAEYSKMFFGAILLKFIYHIYKSHLNTRSLIYLRQNDYDIALESHKITLKNGSIILTT